VTDLTPKIGRKITRLPGVKVAVTEDCTGCGLCADGICFAEAIQVKNGRAEISLECRGCGRCVELCPEGAITLTLNGKEDIKEALHRLDQLVNLD
jgi:heterodisulfide reductase subunit A-like polyferredoxin